MPMFTKILTSRFLAITALCCWISSLFLPVFSLDGSIPIGLQILVGGWGGLLFMYPFWLVNPLFVFVFHRIIRKKVCLVWAWLLFLSAGASLVFGKIPSGSFAAGAPGLTEVQAVGWGWILWIVSAAVLLSAQGLLLHEQTPKSETITLPNSTPPAVIVGLLASVFLIGGSLTASWVDRNGATKSELKRLENLAFKRGGVCKTDSPKAVKASPKLNGTIEHVSVKGFRDSEGMFNIPSKMLEMGIEKYRINTRDFRLEQIGDELMMVSTKADGKSAAILQAYDEGFEDTAQRHVKLMDTTTQKILYQLNAKIMPKDSHFCPDYPPSATADEPIYDWLADTIKMLPSRKIGFNSPATLGKSHWDLSAKWAGSTEKISSTTNWFSDEKILNELVKDPKGSEYPANQRNLNCPENIGWSIDVKFLPLRPFLIGDKAIYPSSNMGYKYALCDLAHVYLYSFILSGDQHLYVALEQRRLADFSTVSFDNIKLKNSEPWKDGDEYYLLQVQSGEKIKSLKFGRIRDKAVFFTTVEPRTINK